MPDVPADLAEAFAAAAPRLQMFAGRVHWRAAVTSTNDVALRLAEAGAPEGTVVGADAQTSGRGRLGRQWFSPPGAGLYVSVVLRPADWRAGAARDRERGATRFITLMAGVALATAVRASTGLAVQLKWPNDLVVPDEGPAKAGRHTASVRARKLGGILAEASAVGARVQHVVVGFGINVQEVAYPPKLAERATSIARELGRPIDRGAVLVEALARLAAERDALAAQRFDAMLAAWRALAPSAHGAAVEWRDGNRRLRGVTAGVDDEGFLLLRVDDRVERVVSGDIEWI